MELFIKQLKIFDDGFLKGVTEINKSQRVTNIEPLHLGKIIAEMLEDADKLIIEIEKDKKESSNGFKAIAEIKNNGGHKNGNIWKEKEN